MISSSIITGVRVSLHRWKYATNSWCLFYCCYKVWIVCILSRGKQEIVMRNTTFTRHLHLTMYYIHLPLQGAFNWILLNLWVWFEYWSVFEYYFIFELSVGFKHCSLFEFRFNGSNFCNIFIIAHSFLKLIVFGIRPRIITFMAKLSKQTYCCQSFTSSKFQFT